MRSGVFYFAAGARRRGTPVKCSATRDPGQVLFTGQQADSFQCDAGSGATRSGGARESHRQVAARAAAVL